MSLVQELLATQRLNQLLAPAADKSSSSPSQDEERRQLLRLLTHAAAAAAVPTAGTSTPAVTPGSGVQRSTIKKISLGAIRARAVLCPVFVPQSQSTAAAGHGGRTLRTAFAMSYRSMTIGSGAENDVVLSSYSHCNYVSDKHAVIFFDEESKKYELLNYSEHGTIVDNVLYSCDFSPKSRVSAAAAAQVSPGKKPQPQSNDRSSNKNMNNKPKTGSDSVAAAGATTAGVGKRKATSVAPDAACIENNNSNKRTRSLRSTSVAAKQQQQQEKEEMAKKEQQENGAVVLQQQQPLPKSGISRNQQPSPAACVLNPVNRQPVITTPSHQQQPQRSRTRACDKTVAEQSSTAASVADARTNVQRMDILVQDCRRRRKKRLQQHERGSERMGELDELERMRRRVSEMVEQECGCRASGSAVIGGSGAGWEGSAPLSHGSLLKFGCIQFVFSITSYGQEVTAPPAVTTVASSGRHPIAADSSCNASIASTISAQSTPTKDLLLHVT